MASHSCEARVECPEQAQRVEGPAPSPSRGFRQKMLMAGHSVARPASYRAKRHLPCPEEMDFRPRRGPAGRRAAAVCHESRCRCFSRAGRQDALVWITRRAGAIFRHPRSRRRRSLDAARRQAAVSRLSFQGLIAAVINPKVSPNCPEESIRNRDAAPSDPT
jgi:hypothetical protein